MKDSVDGLFYKEELTKSPPPKESDYFFVEKILGQKKIQGIEHYLVKYLYYPNKFNQYVKKDNIKMGK